MSNEVFPSLILLTYKGKVLLMQKQDSANDKEQHPWCFISVVKNKEESFESAISRQVQKETGIKIDNIECVSENSYSAKLTDENVNKIERAENQQLDFFGPNELSKLLLSSATREFVFKHGSIIHPIV